MKKVYVVGTCDTKEHELQYVKSMVVAAGVPAVLVDVGTRKPGKAPDVRAEEVAAHHPDGRTAVLGLTNRASAVGAMGLALAGYLATREDLGGIIGLGGSGNTEIATRAMRSLPIGLPKLMVSTIASGDTTPYIGPSDIAMMYPVTDIAGLNRINSKVLGNAAHAIAGMVKTEIAEISSDKPEIALTQFGVTTQCVDQVRAGLEAEFDCMSFHATGIGGQTMEKLIDSKFISGAIDITTTEVADFLIGGVLPCTDDRFGSIARTKIPYVVSCGALDMVNFGPLETIPPQFRARKLFKHNPYVTLMRTTPEENTQIGEWIAERLNRCEGQVRLLIPRKGVSAVDIEGGPFYDPAADSALFDALEKNLKLSASRKLVNTPFHVNDKEFSDALIANLRDAIASGSKAVI